MLTLLLTLHLLLHLLLLHLLHLHGRHVISWEHAWSHWTVHHVVPSSSPARGTSTEMPPSSWHHASSSGSHSHVSHRVRRVHPSRAGESVLLLLLHLLLLHLHLLLYHGRVLLALALHVGGVAGVGLLALLAGVPCAATTAVDGATATSSSPLVVHHHGRDPAALMLLLHLHPWVVGVVVHGVELHVLVVVSHVVLVHVVHVLHPLLAPLLLLHLHIGAAVAHLKRSAIVQTPLFEQLWSFILTWLKFPI